MLTASAIDIGYRNTKVIYKKDHLPPQEFHFPSIAAPSQKHLSAGSTLVRRDTRLVNVDGHNYETGPDAHLLLGPRSTQVLHEEYIHTREYKALFLGALSYIGASHIDVLVGGLPVRHIDTGHDFLKDLMQGEHKVPGIGSVSVKRVMVMPQPLGGLIHHLSHSTKASRQETTLLIDPGYFTLDWTCAVGMKHQPALTGSFPAGISSGLQAAAQVISETIKAPFNDLDTLDRKLRQPEIRIAGRLIDREKIDAHIRDALLPGINQMQNQISGGASIDRIVLCGGGASYYEPLVREAWPHHPVEISVDPLMSNVRGFHAMAMSTAHNNLNGEAA